MTPDLNKEFDVKHKNTLFLCFQSSSSSSMLFLCSFSKEYYTEAWVLVVEKKG